MRPGNVLAARYRLDRPIGSGGMGQVWSAHDQVLGREVAVKVQALHGDAGEMLERFHREAQTAAALQHPNVVTIFDSGIDGSTAFLVMELLPGPDLATYLAGGRTLPEAEVVWLTTQIASGLAAAHRAGVVHRDIKPANLMFDAMGILKIVDFGIARLAQAASARLTATNTLIGSAPYLSPEQVEGRPGDKRSDIYALGCVMTTMLTGRPPFEGDHPLAVAHQHASSPPPRIADRRPGVSSPIDRLVSEMLSKAPEERPESCSVVIDRLERSESGRAETQHLSVAAATEVLGQPTRPLAASYPPMAAAGGRTGGTSGSRAKVLGAGMALLLVALVLALTIWEGNQPSGEAARTSPPTSSAATNTPQQGTRPTATSGPGPATLQQALSSLRTAVEVVTTDGEMEAKKAEELTKRVDEFEKKVDAEGAKDLDKQLEELDKYLGELTAKGELSQAGIQRLETALREVRAASSAD